MTNWKFWQWAQQRRERADKRFNELFSTYTAAMMAYEKALHLARPAALKTDHVRALALNALRTVPEDDPTWRAVLLLIDQQAELDLQDSLVLNVSAEERAYHCGAAASARHIKGVLLDCWAQSKL